ncbi:hypothetical protein EUGRSUZ_C00878 [Eucalyptus grandis]|uniref:Serine aminopeptidase S33 domain-containing protein n=3 Tax=Eucalyptus grandis TaxID=71139 RepID=A0A059CM30_EUCGR|nr:hypothetical protein EUGRSUZ_C00878 [Eucalyptus grandis]KAK3436263.1 hypothetical protein EUGRSUZ_C00878 [Eucalyptus grandis]
MSQSTHNPVVQQQRVVIPNKHGEKLVGLLHETGSSEMVILCHAFRCSKENDTMVNLAAALEKEGISAFRFDSAGTGESEGTDSNFWREADDLRAVIEHFNGANRVTSAIVGHSKGGRIVLLYASKYHDIHTVVNVCACYDLKRGIEDFLGKDSMQKIKEDGFIDVKTKSGIIIHDVKYEYLMDCLNTNMHEACLQIDKNCRVLTVHGSADEVVPVSDALEYAKIISNHKLQIIEGADHRYTSHQAELASIVSSFIKKALEEDREKSSQ